MRLIRNVLCRFASSSALSSPLPQSRAEPLLVGELSANIKDMMSFVRIIEADKLKLYDCKCFSQFVVDDVRKSFGNVHFWV